MANDLNQCNFIGRLGRDPETRYTAGGDAVTNFSIAVGWKSKDKEGAEWVNIVSFGKLAEICEQYLKKGSQVFVSGRFKTEKYTDKEGVERYSTKITADQIQMLSPKPSGGSAPADDGYGSHNAPTGSRPAPNFSDMDDDIPF
jgi:single-strand DNA-binding protein